MSSHREVSYSTIAACPFQNGRILPHADGPWQPLVSTDSAVSADEGQPCVFSLEGSSVRLAPSHRSPPRWQDAVHFNSDLQLPEAHHNGLSSSSPTAATATLCCQWQAKARECIGVAISPRPFFLNQRTYDVCLGAIGNTRTILRRSGVKTNKPSRVCHERAWTNYWLCLVVQEQKQDDEKVIKQEENQPESSPPEERDSEETTSNDLKDEHEKAEGDTKEHTKPKKKIRYQNKLYVGVGDIPGKQCIAILEDSDLFIPMTADEYSRAGVMPFRFVGFSNRGVQDRQAPVPLHIRNIRLTYASNDLMSVLETLSPMDVETMMCVDEEELDGETKALMEEYQEQCRKARARAEKFGVPYNEPPASAFIPWSQERRLRANPTAGFQTGIDLFDPTEKAKQEARRKRFGINDKSPEEPSKELASTNTLPVSEAWDNLDLVGSQRSDPPPTLWKICPLDAKIKEEGSVEYRSHSVEAPTLTPEKIHIFSIDWSAFKQIRTNDIMSYFSVYGPSYVEWLGDLSCNVLFQDRYSAARALENMSMELPTPPPDGLEMATNGRGNKDTSDNNLSSPPDLGAMGWRLCNKLLQKVSTDRYGQRGTKARLLMRIATSLDILQERPSSWPKPPPGFSTKLVLGPGSDFPSRGKGRDRGEKRGRGNETKSIDSRPAFDPSAPGSEHPLLSGALSAGRPGFSVEELEAERAQKRTKLSQSSAPGAGADVTP